MSLGTTIDVSVGNALDPRPVLIVTGLVQEARIAAGPGMTVICSSSNPRQLRKLLDGFDSSTVRGVISFGVAGGLDPSLKSGDVVVATEVVNGASRWRAGLALSEELIDGTGLGGQKVVRAGLAGVEQVVLDRPARRCSTRRPVLRLSIWKVTSRLLMRRRQVCPSPPCV